jgi:hypothetical protein
MADNRFNKATPRLQDEYFRVPASARIWNYWMGGKDNYAVDREAGDAYAEYYPPIFDLAKHGRRFLIRAVRYLAAEAGIRQFLDIGTGLPTEQNTHEVAQAAAPNSKIVYVGNDPVVLAHARVILTNTTSGGVTAYVDCDVHDPETILAEARDTLDFSEPIAVMFMGMLGHVQDVAEMQSIVARVVEAVPPGSYLALWDSTNTSEAYVTPRTTTPLPAPSPTCCAVPSRSASVSMGLTWSTRAWYRSRSGAPRSARGTPIDGYGAVGGKP